MNKEEVIISFLPTIYSSLEMNHMIHLGKNTLLKGKDFFQIYEDDEIYCKVSQIIQNASYCVVGKYPFSFASQLKIDRDYHYYYTFSIPSIFDDCSKIYFSHEIHHLLKDTNPNERLDRKRFCEVIPLFSELLFLDQEKDISVQREMIKSRMMLFKLDYKRYRETHQSEILTYFTNYYDALCLYQRYLESPKDVLDQIKGVLKHHLTTKDLLNHYDFFLKDQSDVVESQMKRLCKII